MKAMLEANARLKSLSLVGYGVMVGGLIAQFATGTFFSSSPVVIAVQSGAVLLVIWARLTFGRRSFHMAGNPTDGGLVTSGPYHFIRHPIYTAICLASGAGAVAHRCWLGGLLSGLVLGSALLRIFCEEVMVTARYPEYRQYAARTWRMVPYIF
jgi:protein-S-isoprenylcysteine O-methyltransferase Ste14